MMNELGPASRALLGAARDGLGPDAAAIARMRSKIGVAVTAGAASSAAVGSTTGSTTAITGGISLSAKLGLAALVAIVVGTGAAVVTRTHPAADTQIAAFEPVEPPAHSIKTAREPAVTTAATNNTTTSATTTNATTTNAVTNDHQRGQTRGIDLAREVELVDRATLALHRNDARGALAAVELYVAEVGDRGQLAEDAQAIELEARCKLGENVATRLAAFDAKWPSSAQRTRLATATRSCR